MWNERLGFAGTSAPTARQLGSLASVASAVYSSGGFYAPGYPAPLQPVIPTYLEVYYGSAVAATASPTPSPTYAPCTGVTAPTNGALGTCTGSLALGGTCQFSCNDGYLVSGPTSCSATMVLAAATCMTGVWTTRKAVPAQSYMPAQGAGTYDTFMYTYIATASTTLMPNRGHFYKYASTADTWTTGVCPVLPRGSVTPSTRSGVTVVGECRLGGRGCCAARGLASLPSTTTL